MTTQYDRLFLSVQAALAGRYSLLTELGRGGMGVVYLAHEVRLDRPVAIKVLPPEHDVPGRRERFLREARAAAQLSHPNIVPIHAVDETDGIVYYAMSYVEGETLRGLVERRGPLGSTEAATMLRDVARALGYAHARGIVHRDVKPDNILIERASGRPLVTDFGIAQITSATTTGVGQAVGTPEYMSPEQASGERVDARSDLYALGAVAFFVLAGRPPFSGDAAAEVMAKHIGAPAPRLSSVLPGAPLTLARIVDRCLTKDPAARFESAERLADAFDETSARPRVLPEPLERWVQSVAPVRFRHVTMLPAILYPLWWGVDSWLDALRCVPRPGGGCEPQSPWENRLEDYVYLAASFALPFLVYALQRLVSVRHVLARGFRLADLRAALVATVRRESAHGLAGAATRSHRLRESIVGAAVATIWLNVWTTCGRSAVWTAYDRWATFAWFGWLALAGLVYAPAFFRRATMTTVEADLRVRSWLWSGRTGALVAWLAGLGLRRRPSTAAATHRPTELALGASVVAVFEALPREVRAQLPGVLDVVEHLETQAGRLRGRMVELDEMRAQAEGGLGKARRMAEDHHRQLADELAGRRSAAEEQLEAVVAALETLRLDLIRLRAGAVTTASITADLEAARRIGAGIDAVIEGRAEVARLVAPTTPAA